MVKQLWYCSMLIGGYCKRFMPTWNKAKSELQNNNVVLRDFEADENPDIMEENNVSGYPTLKLFKPNGEVVSYEGDRSLSNLADLSIIIANNY